MHVASEPNSTDASVEGVIPVKLDACDVLKTLSRSRALRYWASVTGAPQKKKGRGVSHLVQTKEIGHEFEVTRLVTYLDSSHGDDESVELHGDDERCSLLHVHESSVWPRIATGCGFGCPNSGRSGGARPLQPCGHGLDEQPQLMLDRQGQPSLQK